MKIKGYEVRIFPIENNPTLHYIGIDKVHDNNAETVFSGLITYDNKTSEILNNDLIVDIENHAGFLKYFGFSKRRRIESIIKKAMKKVR